MRTRVNIKVLTVATVALIALSGCSSQTYSAIEIPTASSVTISTHEQPQVARVIALANGSAEIISALGVKSILVGRDIASTDDDLRDIPIVTSGHQVIPEKIISLKPDLVIIDKSTGPQNALDALRSAGIKVLQTPEAWTLSDIALKVSAIAEAIGAPERGVKLNRAMVELSPSPVAAASGTRIAFLYLRGSSAIYLIGGKGSGADSLISAIGAVDVGAGALANPFNSMTSESMVSLNPEVILVMTKGLASTGGVAGLVELPGVAQTEAGKKRRIVAVDDSLLLSFGPRTPDLLVQLQKAVERAMQK